VAAIVGFGVAASLACDDLAGAPRLAGLRDALEARLASAGGVTIHGADAPRVANTSCFGGAGLTAETALIALDLAGIAVSSGAACSSGAVEPSRVLRAMGISEARAREAIRVSLGWGSTSADIDHLVESWSIVYRRAHAA
jgi:cysteine desulfurase